MIDLGILGLDTSHPGAFADVIEAHEAASLAAVWDGGDVRDEEYVTEFCGRHDATHVNEPGDMLEAVDAAMVLTVNWDDHPELAKPFLDAGMPVFIDKPIAGRLSDVQAIREAADGARLFGGSAIPHHPELAALEAGQRRRTFAIGYNDPFYYGVHLTDTLRWLAGGDWTCVAPGHDALTATVYFQNGSTAVIDVDGPDAFGEFGFLDVTDEVAAVTTGGGGSGTLYERFIGHVIEGIRSGRDECQWLLDAATLLLGVHAAWEYRQPVTPASPALEAVDVSGADFLERYRS